MKLTYALVATTMALSGCASTTLHQQDMKSYAVGQSLTAPVGGTFLVAQKGTLKTVRRWVGILNSPDGWATETARDSDYLRRELIYSGMSGSTIEIGYREFRGGLAAPAFYQSVKYDLAASKVIVFQNFQIEVQSADNEGIRARLMRD